MTATASHCQTWSTNFQRVWQEPARTPKQIIEKITRVLSQIFPLISALFQDLMAFFEKTVHSWYPNLFAPKHTVLGSSYVSSNGPQASHPLSTDLAGILMAANNLELIKKGLVNMPDADALLHAVEMGLLLLPEEKLSHFQEIVENQGVLDGEDPEVEVFSWTTKCLILFTLLNLAKAHPTSDSWSHTPQEEDNFLTLSVKNWISINRILHNFLKLDPTFQKGLILWLVCPSQGIPADQETSSPMRSLRAQIESQAIQLTKQREFLSAFQLAFFET